MSFYKLNKSIVFALALTAIASLGISAASAECKKLGYVESVSTDPEFGELFIYIREVAGSGNTWYTLFLESDPGYTAAASVAANAVTSGAKVRIEGDALNCPAASPQGSKFMGTLEQISIITTDINS